MVPERPAGPANVAYTFGPFCLLPARQLLLEGETQVRVGSRALEILCALVECAGNVVTKRELISRAWPRSVVEESNLKVTIAALRRALGEGRPGHRYIVNVPSQGYRFVAPVQCIDAEARGSTPQAVHGPGLPYPATRLIGRADVVSALTHALPARRMISLTGPGGIGKTTVALAIAGALADQYEHGAHFVDLAPLSDTRFVPMALAKALGITIYIDDPAETLLAALHDKRLVLVLDSCEHVLDSVAALVEQIAATSPGVAILATTREPLRVRGETVHRLPPLPVPPLRTPLTAHEALSFPSVALFVERAAACLEGFSLSDSDAPIVAEICNKLDGIALAIELAATRVDAFTLRELALLLEDRFRLLSLEQRGASSRHRSLATTLEWSHDLLTPNESTALRRISVFAGSFTLASATAVAGSDCDMLAALESLTSKSLVSADVGGPAVHYRLLDTTRAFAAQRLLAAGEAEQLRRRHAEDVINYLTRAEQESHRLCSSDWVAQHGHRINDVRSALTWSYSSGGDRRLGIALTIAAIPLWTQLSLLAECCEYAERALQGGADQLELAGQDRMMLCAALGFALLYTQGPRPETEALWREGLRIADASADVQYQLKLLWGLSIYLVYIGEYRAALGYLRRFRNLARQHGDGADRLSAERLLATTLHYFGRQASSRQGLERVLKAGVYSTQQAHISRFQFDQRVAARGTLANVLWLQGYPEQANRTALQAIEAAQIASHPVSLCNALGHTAIPIALYMGDVSSAEQLLKRFVEHLEQNALDVWRLLAACLKNMIRIEQGELSGVEGLQDSLGRLLTSGFRLRQSYYLSALARGQSMAGRSSDAFEAIDAALSWCNQSRERWFLPEALRIKGELLRKLGSTVALAQSEQLFRDAMALAHRQGAYSWLLRSATSLSKLLVDRDRGREAAAVICPVLVRFTEGFESVDLKRAAQLAGHLRELYAAESDNSVH